MSWGLSQTGALLHEAQSRQGVYEQLQALPFYSEHFFFLKTIAAA